MTEALLDRLAQANPIPEAAVVELNAELQTQTLALPRLSPESPRRRRTLLVAAVIATGALIAGPALAWRFGVLDFSNAEPAPPRVVKEFETLSRGAPEGMDPGVIAGQTRRAGDVAGHILWVAPTKQGGLCYEWSEASGGCDRLGTVPLGVTWATGLTPAGSQPSIGIVEGFAHARWVDEVEIELDNQSTAHPRLIWISSPIDAGFYYYRAPEGRAIEGVFGLKHGEVVVDEKAPG